MSFVERVINALINIHPWHSLVVHFPTAFATVGFLCILFALWRRNKLFEKFAFFCMAVTAVSTAAAGLAGGAAPYLNVKIFLASSLLLLASIATLARWRKPDLLWNPSTRLLYLSAFLGAFLLATVLGFIGGTIVYGF
jgi:uncharacterized membrane protein